MLKGEGEPRKRDSSGAGEALDDMNDSIFNLRSVADTTNWDAISRRFHGRDFSTIDDFRTQISQALGSVYWVDKEFPAEMMKRLDGKIGAIKARQKKQ